MEHSGRLQSTGLQRVGHDWANSLSLSLSCIGEGDGSPLQCSCWRIPGAGEPGGLPSLGSHRVRHDWSNLAAAAAAILHCVYVPQLSCPFICWWTSRLLPCPGYCKQCCDEHWGTSVSFHSGFLSVYDQQWDAALIFYLVKSSGLKTNFWQAHMRHLMTTKVLRRLRSNT